VEKMTEHLTHTVLADIMMGSVGESDGVDLRAAESLDMAFGDLGYDSVALLEIASRLEHLLHVSLNDEEIGHATTPRDLLRLVNRN
jgi:minimal PKS acyl carrier protein